MGLIRKLREALRGKTSESKEETIWDIFLAFYPNRKGLRCPTNSSYPASWEYLGSEPSPLYKCRTCGGRYNLSEIMDFNRFQDDQIKKRER